jgi:hypothetical protein
MTSKTFIVVTVLDCGLWIRHFKSSSLVTMQVDIKVQDPSTQKMKPSGPAEKSISTNKTTVSTQNTTFSIP